MDSQLIFLLIVLPLKVSPWLRIDLLLSLKLIHSAPFCTQ